MTTQQKPVEEKPVDGMVVDETIKATDAAVVDDKKGDTAVDSKEAERQSTREWLRSLGVVAGDVAARETIKAERVEEGRAARRPEERPRRDTDDVLTLLREGDDEKFVEGIVNLSRDRIMADMSRTERDALFGQKISEFVSNNAPDLPLVVFWSFAQRAERQFPGEVDKQIDWAISTGRAAMEAHNAKSSERESAIRRTQEESDTLDGTLTRPRRRGAREPDQRTTTFVQELEASRAKYE